MKSFLLSLSLVMLASFRPASGIYTIPLNTIDGAPINLAQYAGKKLLFVILPLSSTDTIVSASQLAALETRYQSSVEVIGVPSEESGYTISMKSAVKQLYQAQNANFVLAEGMRVKKGQGQHNLFAWLTDKNLNKHFDQDVQGVGSKFFVDETGVLYAVMSGQVKLSNPVIDKILTRAGN